MRIASVKTPRDSLENAALWRIRAATSPREKALAN
jgi:hypothetical protein